MKTKDEEQYEMNVVKVTLKLCVVPLYLSQLIAVKYKALC